VSEIEIRTPREALMAIRCECRGIHADSDATEVGAAINRLAEDGLVSGRPDTFEYTDRLTDRLAEAHRVLGMVKEYLYGKLPDGDREIEGEINQALALPPDIEASIGLRKHRP
jgi:hypothetical protein